MKLATGFAKRMKSNVVRVLAAAALAGGVMVAATPAAEAQHFAVGVRVGGPIIVRGGPVYRGYYDPYRYDRYREHEEWVRHHEYRYGYYR